MGLLTFIGVALRFSPCGLRYSRILRAGAALALLALVGLRPPSTPVGDAIFFAFFPITSKVQVTGGDIFNFIMLKVSLSDNDAIVFDKQRVIEVLCFTLVNQLVPPP